MPETEWYFSRGDAELYDKCPHARYQRTIRGGRGIVRVGSSFELGLGRIVHKASERILLNEMSIQDAADSARADICKVVDAGEIPQKVHEEFHAQFRLEAQCLTEGLVWAWALFVFPELKANYTVMHVEDRTSYRRDGMVLPTVADVVLESKDDGTLVYPDWKTAAWTNMAWMDSWTRSAQLHTTVRAMEQVFGREIEYCYVQALVKGRWQNGYQQSPLCYGYYNPEESEEKRANKAGKVEAQWLYKHTARKGWTRTPQWASGKSMQQWVSEMPREVALSIVPRTQPIIIDPELAETWWRERVIKERKIQAAKIKLNSLVDTIGGDRKSVV